MKHKNNKYYLGLEGELVKVKGGYPVKIGFIGCGSHAFRNIYPCLQFLPVDLNAVMVVVGFGEDGSPLYLPIVNDILSKGIPVWFEKPPARNADEVQQMIQ